MATIIERMIDAESLDPMAFEDATRCPVCFSLDYTSHVVGRILRRDCRRCGMSTAIARWTNGAWVNVRPVK
jgi:hypothetical protein